MFRDKINFPLLLSLYTLVAVVLYWPAQTGGWYFDDVPNIVWRTANLNLHSAFQQLPSLRGLSNFTFALDRYIWGVDPIASRWVNVALHVANSLLVVQLLRQLTGAKGWKVVLFGLLFLCHPVQSSAVSYIVQRMAVLSAFFSLSSLIFADRYFLLMAEGRLRAANYALIGAVACFLLACMAKENVVLLPVVVLALAWWRGGGTLTKGWRSAFCAVSIIPVTAVVARGLKTGSFSQFLSSSFAPLTDSGGAYYVDLLDLSWLPFRYFLSQLDAFWVYLGLLILPLRQALDYSRPIPPVDPNLVQIGTFLLLALVCYWAVRQRSRYPLSVFGLVWIITFMAVESSFIPLDPVYEHRLYLSFVGWGMILYEQLGRLGSRPALAILLLMVGGYASLTWQRNLLWGDPVSLWKVNVAVAPRSVRPTTNLAKAEFAAGRYAEAAEALLPLKGLGEGFVLQRISEALFFAGRQTEAFETFRKAQMLDETFVGLDSFYAAHSAIVDGDYASAERLLALAEKSDARSVFGLYLRGLLSEGQGDLLRAVEFYQKSIAAAEQMDYRMARFTFDDSYGDWARVRRSQLLERLSGWLADEKAEVSRFANDVVRRVNWANRLLTLGLYDEAISEYLSIKRLAPDVWQMLYNLGIAYEKVGRFDLAENSYRDCLRLVPGQVDVLFNYALLLRNHETTQALRLFESLLAQRPGDGRFWLAYGEALAGLGEKERALHAFAQAALLPGYRGVANSRAAGLKSAAP